MKPSASAAIVAVLTGVVVKAMDYGTLASVGIAIVVGIVVNAVAARLGFEDE